MKNWLESYKSFLQCMFLWYCRLSNVMCLQASQKQKREGLLLRIQF